MTLRRILGAPTALLLGMGVAIGSGIFRTPGIVAGQLHTPWLILLAFGTLACCRCCWRSAIASSCRSVPT